MSKYQREFWAEWDARICGGFAEREKPKLTSESSLRFVLAQVAVT